MGVHVGVGHQGIVPPPSHTIVPVNNSNEINSFNTVFMFTLLARNHNVGKEKT